MAYRGWQIAIRYLLFAICYSLFDIIMFRWFIRNVTTLFLSIAIAITIWIVALNEADPFQ